MRTLVLMVVFLGCSKVFAENEVCIMTEKGDPCVFPFQYKGDEYTDKCAKEGSYWMGYTYTCYFSDGSNSPCDMKAECSIPSTEPATTTTAAPTTIRTKPTTTTATTTEPTTTTTEPTTTTTESTTTTTEPTTTTTEWVTETTTTTKKPTTTTEKLTTTTSKPTTTTERKTTTTEPTTSTTSVPSTPLNVEVSFEKDVQPDMGRMNEDEATITSTTEKKVTSATSTQISSAEKKNNPPAKTNEQNDESVMDELEGSVNQILPTDEKEDDDSDEVTAIIHAGVWAFLAAAALVFVFFAMLLGLRTLRARRKVEDDEKKLEDGNIQITDAIMERMGQGDASIELEKSEEPKDDTRI